MMDLGGGEFSAREEWLPKDDPERIAWEKRREIDRHEKLVSRARQIHDCYERLAPNFGYATRTDTRNFDPTSANGQLMIAVVKELGL